MLHLLISQLKSAYIIVLLKFRRFLEPNWTFSMDIGNFFVNLALILILNLFLLYKPKSHMPVISQPQRLLYQQMFSVLRTSASSALKFCPNLVAFLPFFGSLIQPETFQAENLRRRIELSLQKFHAEIQVTPVVSPVKTYLKFEVTRGFQ